MNSIKVLSVLVALFVFASCGTVAAQQPYPAMHRQLAAFPTLPLPPGYSTAGSQPFCVAGLCVKVLNNFNLGGGMANPTIIDNITVDNVPVPPAPIYGRAGIPLGQWDMVSVSDCPNPWKCEHVMRGTVWRAVVSYGPDRRPILIKASVYSEVEITFTVEQVISLDNNHMALPRVVPQQRHITISSAGPKTSQPPRKR
jgi:hypothetical protein